MHPEDPTPPRPLITREMIEHAVRRMGDEITNEYAGKKLKLIGTLKGCFVFMSDLARAIRLPLTVDFIEVSSYGNETTSSGVVKINKDFTNTIEDHHVILVEDIIDTGHTLNFLVKNMKLRGPASVRIAALLVKEMKQQLNYPIDYRGFNIEDDFVVGYGMDYSEYYRNLDYVGVLDGQLKLFSQKSS